MTEKQLLHQYCLEYVQSRIAQLQAEIKSIQQSANEETKSSAGDKYETGRAMAQLELDRMLGQQYEMEKLMTALRALHPETVHNRVQLGALVSTTSNTFYISVSLGPIKHNTKKYFVISIDSPIAKLLLTKQVGDSIHWQGAAHVIETIA